MIIYYYKDKDEEEFHRMSNVMQDCWIHADRATANDVKEISNILKIDSNDIVDSLDMMEIARIERIEKDVVVVYVRFPYMQEFGVYTATLTIVLSKDYIVTICPTRCQILEKILSEKKSNVSTQMKPQMLIRILLRTVQEYSRTIRKIRAEVINQEKDIRAVSDEEITELTRKEETLNQCSNALDPIKKVIEEILSGKFAILYDKDQDQLEDLLLATEQAQEMCFLSLRIISSLRNSVQVIITNQFNRTIRLLTSLTIILNFPTTIASIYGMNVALPFASNPSAFFIIMGFIVSFSIGAFYFFTRRKWI